MDDKRERREHFFNSSLLDYVKKIECLTQENQRLSATSLAKKNKKLEATVLSKENKRLRATRTLMSHKIRKYFKIINNLESGKEKIEGLYEEAIKDSASEKARIVNICTEAEKGFIKSLSIKRLEVIILIISIPSLLIVGSLLTPYPSGSSKIILTVVSMLLGGVMTYVISVVAAKQAIEKQNKRILETINKISEEQKSRPLN